MSTSLTNDLQRRGQVFEAFQDFSGSGRPFQGQVEEGEGWTHSFSRLRTTSAAMPEEFHYAS